MNTGDILFILVTFAAVIFLNLISFGRTKGNNLIPGIPPLPSRRLKYRSILSRHNIFYTALTKRNRHHFENRVHEFIARKKFIPRGGLREVTLEMQTLIAASAIQITFGYPKVYFNHFGRILVYPDDYYSTITKSYHKGEVNRGGLIVLSWKSFKEGYMDHSDGRNLGLHEMAHALRLVKIVENSEYDFYDNTTMKTFESEAHMEIAQIKSDMENGKSFFRSYGASNIDEFFAVAVECFFEKPALFRNYNPALYDSLANILRINSLLVFNSAVQRG